MLARGWQIIPEKGVIRSREPFKCRWAPTIYLERLKLELSNFYTQIGYIKSQQKNDKLPWKGAYSGSRHPFYILGSNDIYGTADARVCKFYTQVGLDYIISKVMDDKPPLKGAWSGSHVTWPIFSFDSSNHISVIAVARVAKFCIQLEYITR